MKNFKKEAEEWANEEIRKLNFAEKELEVDFINSVILGLEVGYRIDKEGNKTRLTQQELFGIRSHPDSEVMTFNSMEEYLKSVEK